MELSSEFIAKRHFFHFRIQSKFISIGYQTYRFTVHIRFVISLKHSMRMTYKMYIYCSCVLHEISYIVTIVRDLEFLASVFFQLALNESYFSNIFCILTNLNSNLYNLDMCVLTLCVLRRKTS